ncbi:MAG: rhodanese-like domain-containing protein [Phycisphaerales bacterium]|nr:rhodanese-like domain-containing protein [Phycisphaerales bacterium]
MHICTTATRVLAIIGLGSLAGIGHSMIHKPVSFDAPALPAKNPVDPGETDVAPKPAEPVDTGGAETDPLDIHGPEGTITLREALALYNDGAYFVDARIQEEYDEAHIPGAYFLPAQKIRTQEGLDELATIPPDLPVVIYCVGGECDASTNTRNAILRLGMGFTDVRILGLGFVDWEDAGLPVEHADGSITGESP